MCFALNHLNRSALDTTNTELKLMAKAPIIGFNFGARRMDRVRQAIRVAFIAQITSATVLVSLLAAFPSVFAAWFTSSPEVIGIVTRMMPVFVAGWGVFGIQMGAQCALVGMGQAKQSVFLALSLIHI